MTDVLSQRLFGAGSSGGGHRAERLSVAGRSGGLLDALGDVRQGLLHLVNQDQAQVAFLQPIHGRVDGFELTINLW